MREQTDNRRSIWTMIKILIVLLIFSALIAVFFENDNDKVLNYNVAIIPIKGTITAENSGGLFEQDTAGSADTVRLIEKAGNDKNVRAVILEINSPGGSPVATDEIAQAVKSLKDKDILTVAWIGESGASGAYWIASSADYIIANRMSIVGSIGVYGSYLELYGLLNKYNVTYRRLVSGEYKDTGTPYRPLSSAEEILLQEKLDTLHKYFITAVAENRGMDYDAVKRLSTGEIFLGVEAKDNGLVDELGGKAEVINYIENKLNITVSVKEFSRDKSFIESLTQAVNHNSYYMGQGIASGLVKDEGMKITT